MDVTTSTERTATEFPRWLGWLGLLKLIPVGLIAFVLYKLWGSELHLLARVLLTPLTIIAVGFAYNMIIGLPLALYLERKLEKLHVGHVDGIPGDDALVRAHRGDLFAKRLRRRRRQGEKRQIKKHLDENLE